MSLIAALTLWIFLTGVAYRFGKAVPNIDIPLSIRIFTKAYVKWFENLFGIYRTKNSFIWPHPLKVAKISLFLLGSFTLVLELSGLGTFVPVLKTYLNTRNVNLSTTLLLILVGGPILMILVNTFFDTISVAQSYWVGRKMSNTRSITRIIFYAIFDIFVSLVMGVIAMIFAMAIFYFVDSLVQYIIIDWEHTPYFEAWVGEVFSSLPAYLYEVFSNSTYAYFFFPVPVFLTTCITSVWLLMYALMCVSVQCAEKTSSYLKNRNNIQIISLSKIDLGIPSGLLCTAIFWMIYAMISFL